MTLVTLALAGMLGAAVGAALAWLALRRSRSSEIAYAVESAESVPFSASVEEVARAVASLFAERADLGLLAIYAGREGAETLEAVWRSDDAHGESQRAPLHAPETLLIQLRGAQLVDVDELECGLRPGLPPGDPAAVASQVEANRIADELAAADVFSENPFELEDAALTGAASPTVHLPSSTAASVVDQRAIAARVVALPWYGPFDWRGLLVARPTGESQTLDLEWLDRAAPGIGQRLGIHREAAERARLAAAPPAADFAPGEPAEPATVFLAGPAPAEEDPVAARLRKADARLAEALLAPRRTADLVRSAVGLLAEGLAPDRCYAVEVDGLHTRPVEHERRSEAAAPAMGTDFGAGFLEAVRARSAPTIKAITLDAAEAAEMIPEWARERLGPVSRMLVPVQEKGRITLVFVAEWIDSAKRWNGADVAFAERVVARVATARERILQYEALAEQTAHAREETERVEAALEQAQALLAGLPDAVLGLDADGAIVYANRAAARLLGRLEFELMGRWIGEAAADLEGDAATWERVLTATTTERFPAALAAAGEPVDLAVAPGVESTAFARVVVLATGSRRAAAPTPEPASGIARELVEPVGRLLGHLDLIAGGSYGRLSPAQEDAVTTALKLGSDVRACLSELLRSTGAPSRER